MRDEREVEVQVGVDWRVDLRQAVRVAGGRVAEESGIER